MRVLVSKVVEKWKLVRNEGAHAIPFQWSVTIGGEIYRGLVAVRGFKVPTLLVLVLAWWIMFGMYECTVKSYILVSIKIYWILRSNFLWTHPSVFFKIFTHAHFRKFMFVEMLICWSADPDTQQQISASWKLIQSLVFVLSLNWYLNYRYICHMFTHTISPFFKT